MTVRWKDKLKIALANNDRMPVTDVSAANVDKYTTPRDIYEAAVSDTVVVEAMSDFPAAVAGVITLESKLYIINSALSTSDRFEIPTGISTRLFGNIFFIHGITYTGAGSMFTGTDFASIDLSNMFLSCPSGTLFDIQPGTPQAGGLFVIDCTLIDCSSLGTVKNINTFGTTFTAILDIGTGLVFDSVDLIAIFDTQSNSWKNQSTSMFTIQGTNKEVTVSGFSSRPKSNESVFDIKAGSTIEVGSVTGSPTNLTDGGSVFASGSKNQEDINWKFIGNTNIPDSDTKGEAIIIGSALTTDIPAQNALVFANVTGFATDESERVTFSSDGFATYTGLEDASIILDGSVGFEPATATKTLSSRFIRIDDADRTVTFTNGTNVINEVATPRVNGELITFKNTAGTLPAELRDDIVYYVVNKATDSFQVSYTSGGSAVAFTDDGTPTNSYACCDAHGSFPSNSIASGTPRDVIPQALMTASTNDEVGVVVSNESDAVDIDVNDLYYRVKT